MKKTTFINKISGDLYDDKGVIFVGSGISAKSLDLDWFKLIEPFSEELGIEFDCEHDDLPMMAQYIVNHYTGNRGPLINSIVKQFNVGAVPNSYHKSLALTKVSTIWTTNYDDLLERAFSDFSVDVKVNDDSISRSTIDSDIEILKIHGCISRSRHDEIIITQEDYEDFFEKKPAISQRLSNDLLKKSFLFIGYSYRDPNIKNIMIAARRLSRKVTQQHYLIMVKPKDEDECILKNKERRLKLWSGDLRRLGISTLLIDTYEELDDILVSISQKSRGKTVYVTGSHEKTFSMAKSLGRDIANEKDIKLISGQSSGVGSDIVSAFIEKCIEKKYDINNRIQIFPNPYAANPDFSNDVRLVEDLKKCRAKLMSATQVVVIFNGGMGTEAEIEIAKRMNCKIIPVAKSEEDLKENLIKDLIEDEKIVRSLEKYDKEYYDKLLLGKITQEDVMKCIKKMLD